MTADQRLTKVRRARRKYDRAKEELEREILVANAEGVPIRVIAEAADCGHGSIHRVLVRART